MYEFSNLYALTWFSKVPSDKRTLAFFCAIISSALLKFPGPCEPKNHKTIEIAKIIFPAPVTNALVYSKTFKATFLNIGTL